MPTHRSETAEWSSQPGIRIPPATGLAGAGVLHLQNDVKVGRIGVLGRDGRVSRWVR
ncbi:MAG TPA: hypothetical protein VH438_01750 [Gemmatimonadales bacterium]